MTEHLPECPVEKMLRSGRTVGSQTCICDALRACEERVRSNPDWRSHILLDELERCLALARKEWEVQARPGVVSIADYRSVCKWAYIKGLDAAREAVASLRGYFGTDGNGDGTVWVEKIEALSVIDALREGDQP